jgi:choline kinase
MKSIILAGGLGTRLDLYTKNIPKCMLNFLDKPILQRQIDTYRKCGVNDIIVVRKYLADKINISGVKYYDELDFNTHMVVGLFNARNEFNDDIIMSYGDLLFEENVLNKVIKFEDEIGVVVDVDWKPYWKARYGSINHDLETLIINDNEIKSLGKQTDNPEDMNARYVGIIKFSKNIIKEIERIYDDSVKNYWDKPWYNSKSFKKAYMTDFLQAIIDSGVKIKPIIINKGWLEFDTNEDYEKVKIWVEEGTLNRFYSLKN